MQPFEYEITNFKGFPEPTRIPLRPITLIYGPNSSGKSSILQSLLLLKQTIDEAENPETLLLPKGNLVDLGGYKEFLNGHDTDRQFAFGFSLPAASIARARTFRRPTGADELPSLGPVGVQVTLGYDEASASAIIQKLAFFAQGIHEPVSTFIRSSLTDEEKVRLRVRGAFSSGERQETVLRGDYINRDHPFWRLLRETEQLVTNRYAGAELDQLIASVRKQIKRIERLLRPTDPTKRTGARSRSATRTTTNDKKELESELRHLEAAKEASLAPFDVAMKAYEEQHARSVLLFRNFLPFAGTVIPSEAELQDPPLMTGLPWLRGHALNPTQAIVDASNVFRSFLQGIDYIGPMRESPERHYIYSGNVAGQVGKTGRQVADVLFKNRQLLNDVNTQLERFNIGYKVAIAGAKQGELNDVFSVRLVDSHTNVNVSILDVGFGISQVLPVLVQSMLSHSRSLCIEQPEIHLHPRLQADIGSLLAECIKPPYSNRFVVETHSQHLMLRIQRLIREGQLSSEDVAVLYVDRGANGSRCLELRLDRAGEFIDEWPGGFFEEGYAEIFGV